jgi:hypothetical protein
MSETLAPTEIRLPEAEAELALAETNAVLAAASAEAYRAELTTLAEAIEAGTLGEAEAASLEPIVELALQTGRIRAIYGPPGEQAALRLYRRLPRGRELQRSAREVSEALSSLQGQVLEGATVSAYGPAAFTLTLATAEGKLSLRLDRQGARVTSVEV